MREYTCHVLVHIRFKTVQWKGINLFVTQLQRIKLIENKAPIYCEHLISLWWLIWCQPTKFPVRNINVNIVICLSIYYSRQNNNLSVLDISSLRLRIPFSKPVSPEDSRNIMIISIFQYKSTNYYLLRYQRYSPL